MSCLLLRWSRTRFYRSIEKTVAASSPVRRRVLTVLVIPAIYVALRDADRKIP